MLKNNLKQLLVLLLLLGKTDFLLGDQHTITIVGSGYVGLTLAAVLLQENHAITCIDTDISKINSLRNRKLYIYEPLLEELLFNSANNNQVLFKDSLESAPLSEIYYICVPTPLDQSDHCDLSFLYSAFNKLLEICKNSEDTIICVKSTVPPGTLEKLALILKDKKSNISLLYNPEFMREGTALTDIYTNPIVIGGESPKAIEKIKKINLSFSKSKTVQCIETSFTTAEMIKYSWNSYAALRITFINELASLSSMLHANIADITKSFFISLLAWGS